MENQARTSTSSDRTHTGAVDAASFSDAKNSVTNTVLSDRSTLTVREAAAVLRVNVKTLYAEINAQRFPAIRLGRVIRIARSVVASFIEQGRVVPTGAIHASKTRT
jgi:excisionase family DNA binding protein